MKHFLNEKILPFFSSLMKMNLKGRKGSLKIFIFFAAGVLFLPWALAQAPNAPQVPARGKGPFKVAILPVTIHSPEDLDYMQAGLTDMLTSRVELEGRISVLEKGAVKKALSQTSGEIDSETARKLGETLGADYVVYGSLTKLGDSSSLDLKVLNVKGEKPGSSVYIQTRKMDEVIARLDLMARKIDEKILGYPLSPPPAERPAVAEKPSEGPKPRAAIPAPPPALSPMTPARPERGVSPTGFWKSTPFPFRMVGMAMGDLDGDGRNEVVLIDKRNLWIYRWENEFKLIQKLSGGKWNQYLSVDVADINKDGKAEIFVTSLVGDETESSPRKLSSFVVAFEDGAYRVTARNLEWYLRVVDWGKKGPVLLGQRRGYETPYEPVIYEMGWDGKGYKKVRKIEASKVFSVYGFAPFFDGGKTFYAFIDSNFRLKVLDSKGSMVWTSQADYGSDISFRTKPLPTGVSTFYEGDDISFVNVRVISRGNELLILRNHSPLGHFFKRQTYYTGGEIESLVWSGAMFMETWKSVEIPGTVVDFQNQNLDGAPGRELVVAVNLPRESIFSGQAGSALMIGRLQ